MEYPAGSTIHIRKVINRNKGKDFHVSYRVSIPAKLAKKRILKQFAEAEASEAWASQQYKGFSAKGHQHFVELTAKERDDAQHALSILKGLNISLSEAAKLAKAHHRPADKAVTVSKAIELLIEEKEAANLRPQSIRDLKNRLKLFAQSFGDTPAHHLKTPQIQRWLDEFTRPPRLIFLMR